MPTTARTLLVFYGSLAAIGATVLACATPRVAVRTVDTTTLWAATDEPSPRDDAILVPEASDFTHVCVQCADCQDAEGGLMYPWRCGRIDVLRASVFPPTGTP